mmetsp:Transcript_27412/g.49356  ORF Transcript_27412/g.49356 Transcript_27412/m.49356 type:complete len:125 (-) Transcript_27412:520-894(-)
MLSQLIQQHGLWVLSLPPLYLLYVWNIKQAWLGNKAYIDPLYRKPSFARYNSNLCADARDLESELVEISSGGVDLDNTYYRQGRGVTRDMLVTARTNYSSGSEGNINPNISSRTSNRGLLRQQE